MTGLAFLDIAAAEVARTPLDAYSPNVQRRALDRILSDIDRQTQAEHEAIVRQHHREAAEWDAANVAERWDGLS